MYCSHINKLWNWMWNRVIEENMLINSPGSKTN